MRDALLIARREYLEQIRGKAFRITTALIPGLFAIIVAIMYFAGTHSGVGKHIAIAASDAGLAQEIKKQLNQNLDVHMLVDVVSPAIAADRSRLVTQVDKKQIDGFLWIEPDADGSLSAVYESRTSGDIATESRLGTSLNRALVRSRLMEHGMTEAEVKAVTASVTIETEQIKNGQAAKSSSISSFVAGYAMAFLLSFTTIMYGLNVGRSVIQEKTSRIFEVMLSTVQPRDLLAGKLIGIGAVGLTQLLIWGVLLMAALVSGLFMSNMLVQVKAQISVPVMVLFVVYFVLGYLLYSALFAGLAATVETEQELQQYTPIAAVPIWASFSLISFILADPNSKVAVIASLIPPCTPITMFLRMASQMPPYWQIALSIVLMALSILVVLWVSSRLYRIGILMYGKRATLPEMMRWLRTS